MRWLTLMAGMAVGGCGLHWEPFHHVGRLDRPDASTTLPDGGLLLPWGRWAARQPERACARESVFTVDTTDDELEGGAGLNDRASAGSRLSLAEALWLAANHPGPDTILFDETVFPLEVPSTIVIDGSHELPQSLAPVCIDARERGVFITWGPAARTVADGRFVWPIENGSFQIGLEMAAPPWPMKIETGGQVAGCRFVLEQARLTHNYVALNGGIFGHGNVAEGTGICLTGHGVVNSSFFGFNPTTRHSDPCYDAIYGFGGPLTVEDSFILAHDLGIQSYSPLTLKNSRIGVADDSTVVVGSFRETPYIAVDLISGTSRLDSNVIRARTTGVTVLDNMIATFTHNRIQAREGIQYVGNGRVIVPPTITAVMGGQVRGDCPEPGRVELFSGDSRDLLADVFIGEAECDANLEWVITEATTSGSSLVATLTRVSGSTTGFSVPFLVP